MEYHTIDAAGKAVGRVASEAAKLLRGVSARDFSPERTSKDEVRIVNAHKIRIPSATARGIRKHSMHPGGFREIPRHVIYSQDPSRLVRHAISGMLPKNRLRSRMLKRLRIFSGDAQ